MASRSTARKTTTSRSSRATSATAASVRRAPARTSRKRVEEMEEMAPETSSSMRGLPKLPFSRRTSYIILLVVGLAALFYVANKYLVVAWVDKKPVTAFEYYSTLSKRYGNDVSEELIVQKLLESEAAAKDITISDSELNSEIQKIEEQQGGADKLNQILQAQNISRPEFERLVKLQLMRSKLFASDSVVTDTDVDAYIAENGEAFAPTTDASTGATVDPKKDPKLRESIMEQLKQQKINASFSAWLQGARQSDRVSKNWQ